MTHQDRNTRIPPNVAGCIAKGELPQSAMGAILRNLLSELWETSMSAPKDWFENKDLNRT
jgi:hypothetical protein